MEGGVGTVASKTHSMGEPETTKETRENNKKGDTDIAGNGRVGEEASPSLDRSSTPLQKTREALQGDRHALSSRGSSLSGIRRKRTRVPLALISFKTPSLSGDETELWGCLWISRDFLEHAAEASRRSSDTEGVTSDLHRRQSAGGKEGSPGGAASSSSSSTALTSKRTEDDKASQSGVVDQRQTEETEKDRKDGKRATLQQPSKWWHSASWEGGWNPGGEEDDSLQNALKNLRTGRFPIVILVHQYSLMGGRSELVQGKARILARQGLPSITFDLRGVGYSSGRATVTGETEVRDVVAICRWAITTLQTSNIFLVGTSAGAPISGSAVPEVDEVRGWVGIGYVFGFFASILFRKHYSRILTSPKPKLFIHAGSDGFTAQSTFDSFYKQAKDPKEKVVVSGVGHFDLEGPSYDAFSTDLILQFIEKYSPTAPAGSQLRRGGSRDRDTLPK
ncbi:esterase lipase thioesterase domain-containing protein [Cystoisospora suis]|uniref:Esterase lipase thioesterase domain-containing protein n=1 Tax=Cystoisospora suis TaxID=483139 RepID=A0A2C6LBG2_9APIC|nr:esterase lipase thioesterase domain-containing protein [Cystoisospora suis]